mmetsp:Transcript_22319/g.41538  ORF Transcript_22319/g.41538 Transcript_22319/m.41538 type:complete len:261 (-) Transcript_22319:96-878(-)
MQLWPPRKRPVLAADPEPLSRTCAVAAVCRARAKTAAAAAAAAGLCFSAAELSFSVTDVAAAAGGALEAAAPSLGAGGCGICRTGARGSFCTDDGTAGLEAPGICNPGICKRGARGSCSKVGANCDGDGDDAVEDKAKAGDIPGTECSTLLSAMLGSCSSFFFACSARRARASLSKATTGCEVCCCTGRDLLFSASTSLLINSAIRETACALLSTWPFLRRVEWQVCSSRAFSSFAGSFAGTIVIWQDLQADLPAVGATC